jgi:hypothetical protein
VREFMIPPVVSDAQLVCVVIDAHQCSSGASM